MAANKGTLDHSPSSWSKFSIPHAIHYPLSISLLDSASTCFVRLVASFTQH